MPEEEEEAAHLTVTATAAAATHVRRCGEGRAGVRGEEEVTRWSSMVSERAGRAKSRGGGRLPAADEAKGIRVGTGEAEAARVRGWSGALGFVRGNPHDPGPRPPAFPSSRADLY